MNKAEFVDRIAARTGDRAAAKEVVDVAIDEIQRAVVKGEKVSFAGFGVFEKRQRAARMARNPRTGEAVKVKKTVVPAFRPGTGFKELVTGKRKAAKSAPAAKKAAPAKKAATTTTAKKTTAKKAAKKTTRAASTASRSTATSRVAAKKTTTAKKAAPAKKAATAKKAVRKTATKAAAKKTAAKKTTKRGRSLCRAPNRFGARWGTRPTRTGKRAFRSRLNALAAFPDRPATGPGATDPGRGRTAPSPQSKSAAEKSFANFPSGSTRARSFAKSPIRG
ncbi:HU family DNA-binding protein [Glycomyces terrestris]|uniref:HU family DNA-binding protein n=1 Tax=Glycomyces terrestris TaxID=2493553 RepID=A0A426V028_9ACTN|nr:HU family DNA-binding protein [Glycomyces terrestris]RRS00203.1 HU family DNA-binding protein [Glycomyces terrestris]